MPALRSCELLCDAGQTGCFGDRAECTGQADRCGSAAREHRQLRVDLLRDMRAEGRPAKRLGGQRNRGAGMNKKAVVANWAAVWFVLQATVTFVFAAMLKYSGDTAEVLHLTQFGLVSLLIGVCLTFVSSWLCDKDWK